CRPALKPYQSGQLHADLMQGFGGNRGSRVADWAGQPVDASHVAGQDLPGNRQPGRQHNARAKGTNPRGDRADDSELGYPAKIGWRESQRRAAATPLAPDAGIEFGPDQIARLRDIIHSLTRRSRAPYPVPN